MKKFEPFKNKNIKIRKSQPYNQIKGYWTFFGIKKTYRLGATEGQKDTSGKNKNE